MGALGSLEAGVKELELIKPVIDMMKVPLKKSKSVEEWLNAGSFLASPGSAASSSASPLALCDLTAPVTSTALVPLKQPSLQEVSTCVEDVEGSLRALRDMSSAFEAHAFRKEAKLIWESTYCL